MGGHPSFLPFFPPVGPPKSAAKDVLFQHKIRVEVFFMLSPLIFLLMNGLFFTLRLSGGGGSFPRPLKPEEERKYLERWAAGDLEARNILVEHNLRLVAHIVKKYYAQTGDQDDLISIGTIGLIKGVSTFKPDRNVKLATYASRCIENAIRPRANPAGSLCS